MAKSSITTRAINNTISNPEKVKAFIVSAKDPNKSENDYITHLSRSIFTLLSYNPDSFPRIIELTKNSNADITYLIEVLTQTKEFKNCEFRIVPIIKLYEALLRENWETVKADRDVLDEIESYSITPECNVQICDAIGRFLKEFVLSKSHNIDI